MGHAGFACTLELEGFDTELHDQWQLFLKVTLRDDLLNAVYFRRGITCTVGLTNDLIDGGQPRET